MRRLLWALLACLAASVSRGAGYLDRMIELSKDLVEER